MHAMLRGLLIFGCAALISTAALAEKRMALVIGNGAYKDAPLQNPTRDADIVSTALTHVGFTVDVVTNADLGAFDAAVRGFAERAKGADIALFYFAGHGFAVNDSLKPTSILMSTSADVTSGSERVLRAGGIPLDDIAQALVGQARSTLIFIDACRNDPRVSRAVGGAGRGLSRLDPVKGGNILIGISTRLGDTAADGEAGKGSPFARAFALDIEAPGLRIDDAFRKMRDAVRAETDGKQVPDIVQDDLPEGAMVLANAAPVASVPPVAPAPADPKFVEASQIWASLQSSTDAAVLEAFRQRYEGTFFATMAEIRIKQIAAPSSAPQQVATTEIAPAIAAAPAQPAVTDCDRLAASLFDADAIAPGVAPDKIDSAAAVTACRSAVATYPGERRLKFQYARALASAKNFTEAMQWYQAAAAAGSVAATNNIGTLHSKGLGVERDYVEAMRWFRKAAEAGNTVAMLNVGGLYAEGSGVTKDSAEALKWYRESAEAGNTDAMTKMGYYYYMGLSVFPDYVQSMKWYMKGAEHGNGEAMLNVALLYASGKGADQNYGEAVKWLLKGADAGNTEAMNRMGLAYASGKGVAQDYAEAMKWYLRSAEAGNKSAMFNIAGLYAAGKGVARDDVAALNWYRKAADAGNKIAMKEIANRYQAGLGVAKDEAEAERWRQLAR